MVVTLHLVVCVSILWSPYTADALKRIPDILLVVLIVTMAVPLFSQSVESNTEILLKAFFWFSLAFAGMDLLVNGLAFGDLSGEISNLGAGGIGIARLHATAILAAAFFWIRSRKTYWLVPMPVLFIPILLSGSRSAIPSAAGSG